MKKIVGEILKGKNIDENLKAYYGKFMEINNKYALIRLAMNYYTYYTIISEDVGVLHTENMQAMNTVNSIIENTVNGMDELLESNICDLNNLRNDIINQVQDITCYVDRLRIYEHALNRVEYRFKEQEFPKDYSDEKITRKLMQFILEDEENVAINNRISLVLGQLPIRLTKNKFYEMISNGLSIYKGSEKENLNDFLYMLKTVSMLETTPTMESNYPYLSEALKELEEISFKDITAEQYEDMHSLVTKSSEYIDEVMNADMMLQEIVNDLLINLYTTEYRADDNVVKACKEIIKYTNLLFLNKFSAKSQEEIEDMFVMLEGEQEDIYPKLTSYDITDQIRESYGEKISELGLDGVYDIVYKLPRLSADSMFIELDKIMDLSIVDERVIEEEEGKLFAKYAQMFANNEKIICRAVMATAIAELPVFFNNISELQDFIYNTLTICTDKAEKLACVEILNGIMEE